MNNQRNMILAMVLTALLLFGWDAAVRHFYPNAGKGKPVAAASSSPAPAKATREGGLASAADVALEAKDLKVALQSGGRLPVSAAGLSGSINLTGAVIDDLATIRHSATLKAADGPQRIFSPAGTPAQQFAQFGWVAANGTPVEALPNATTVWSAPVGARLTEATPVTLTWANPSGQTFNINFIIDKDYMISVRQTVVNHGAAPISVQPFALINRTDKTASVDTFQLHSGPFGAFDGSVQFKPNYKDVTADSVIRNDGKADWLGFTDVYWMSTLIPGAAPESTDFRALGNGIFRADLIYPAVTVAPGQQLDRGTRLFAGAKESAVLDRYQDSGITNFGLAIDWGWFRWFEKPIFWLLEKLFSLVKNFGIALILLTFIIRGIMFPIANKQFSSMASMKAIQPKMKAIQDRYKDDKPKQQQEIMELYKKEGVNPLSGCLPMLATIPVFFGLYKVLTLAVEMRHQPFFGWIKDLSAPDPLHILNLFGLLPFTPPSFLGIGILAILLGITMWLQFKLNPAQMDPQQQQIFAIMPWMMMFMLAPFAAGLLIYYITSNLLTIAQQKYLYSRHPALQAQAAT